MQKVGDMRPSSNLCYMSSEQITQGGSGDDANKKEVRDLCRAAVLLRFGY